MNTPQLKQRELHAPSHHMPEHHFRWLRSALQSLRDSTLLYIEHNGYSIMLRNRRSHAVSRRHVTIHTISGVWPNSVAANPYAALFMNTRHCVCVGHAIHLHHNTDQPLKSCWMQSRGELADEPRHWGLHINGRKPDQWEWLYYWMPKPWVEPLMLTLERFLASRVSPLEEFYPVLAAHPVPIAIVERMPVYFKDQLERMHGS